MINYRVIYKFCNEDISKIENYDLAINDTSQTYDCHHKLEIELNMTANELREKNLYYNRPASELIFLTHSEHRTLHNLNPTKEYTEKLSIAAKKRTGPKASRYGAKLTDETKQKIGIKARGRKRTDVIWNKGLHWKLVDGKRIYY